MLFGSLFAPVYFELEPLLLWFYFIWGPRLSCLFLIRALVALVLFFGGALLLLFIFN